MTTGCQKSVWVGVFCVLFAAPVLADHCSMPSPTDSLKIISPAENDEIRGKRDLEVTLSLPGGAPTSIEVWLNNQLNRKFDGGRAGKDSPSGITYSFTATIGELDDDEIHDAAGDNVLEVVERNTAGCRSSGLIDFDGIDTKSRALVIGISNYMSVDKLKLADRDADLMAAHFKDLGVDIVKELTNEQATWKAIRTELFTAKQSVSKQAAFYLYFSGHGFATGQPDWDAHFRNNPAYQVYIVPFDATVDEPTLLLSMQEIMEDLAGIRAETKIFIFDSCFAGRSTAPDGPFATKSVIDQRHRGNTPTGQEFLSTVSSSSVSYGLLATKPGGVSYEIRTDGVGGAFTHFLLEAADKLDQPVFLQAAAGYSKEKITKLLKSVVDGYADPSNAAQQEEPQEMTTGPPGLGAKLRWSKDHDQ
jgi:hypothetical protein